MSRTSWALDECETADAPEGPWRDIVDGKTSRWIRVKQTEWDKWLADLGGYGTAVTYDGKHVPLSKVFGPE